jgi:predicted MFS family arabinose efflux permease
VTIPEPHRPAQSGEVKFSSYQKFVVMVLAFLQFTIVLDFMLIAPLGALVVPALKITPAQFGLIVSAYALSAGVSGILTAGFADRFDRKKLLLFFYSGFLFGTLLCGLASSYFLLLAARMVTGVFAGVVGSIAFAIVTDLFPMQMRGRVMGVLQTAFAASSILGIPFGLLLSNRWSWNAPFFLTAAIGAAVGAVIWAKLRPIDEHLKHHPDRSPVHHLLHTLSNGSYVLGFLATGILSLGGFMLMPFMSIFVVNNVGLAIGKLPLVYMITGGFSIVTGPLIGRASDAFGKFRVFGFGCAVTIVMVAIYTHLSAVGLGTLVTVMVLLQVGIFSRMISASALTSALPEPPDRGAYMSISSSLQQAAGGLAAMLAGMIVVQTSTGALLHFDILGYVLICTTLVSLLLMYLINRRVGDAQRAGAGTYRVAGRLQPSDCGSSPRSA